MSSSDSRNIHEADHGGNRMKKRRLLLANDDVGTLESFEQLLRLAISSAFQFTQPAFSKDSLEIVKACDGRAAANALSEDGPFDLVITDINMPGIGGGEIIRRLRNGDYETGARGTPRSTFVIVQT